MLPYNKNGLFIQAIFKYTANLNWWHFQACDYKRPQDKIHNAHRASSKIQNSPNQQVP